MPRWEDMYDAVASLGEGTFGQVLHVRNKTSNVEAALKRVSRWTGGGDHEIALMQHLGSHPNLVQLLDFLTTTDSVCLVVELCGAGDLLNFFHHFEPQGLCHGDEKSVRFLMAGLTLALEHLQGKGVVHRDVKPENIFLTEMLVPKLGDFGAAKFADEIRPSQCSPASAAPELLAHHQNREVPHSFPMDWWSAGVIAAELLSGRSPVFDAELGDWRFGKFAAIEQKVRQGIPAGLLEGPGSDLVHGLCAQDSSMRFGAKEVQEHPFFDMFDWSGYKDGKSGMATPFCETYEVWKRSLAPASA
eukprot:Skav229886  [mRNA]  locus=scaffold247:418477:419382:+ [translate_table: standard]